jgi:hypothetical protein
MGTLSAPFRQIRQTGCSVEALLGSVVFITLFHIGEQIKVDGPVKSHFHPKRRFGHMIV